MLGCVVVTMVVTVTGASSTKELGDGVHMLAGIASAQETVTAPVKPPAGANESWNVAGCPAGTLAVVELPGAGVMVMSVPLPESVMDCGLAGPLSESVIAPARAPEAVGVKVTEIVQEELAGTPFAQLSVSAKSPLAVMLVNVRVELPALLTVTLWTELVEPSN